MATGAAQEPQLTEMIAKDASSPSRPKQIQGLRHRRPSAKDEPQPEGYKARSRAEAPGTTESLHHLDYPLMTREFQGSGPIPMERLAWGSVLTFFVLVAVGSQAFSPYRQPLMDGERVAAACGSMAFAIMLCHLVIKRAVSPVTLQRDLGIPLMAILLVAGASNLTMALCEVPVVTDAITGHRVHLLRWVEWTVLTFTISYIICEFWPYVPKPSHEDVLTKHSIAFSLTQTFSSACGFLFPFITILYAHVALFFFSFSLYLVCYVPLYMRWHHLSSLKKPSHPQFTPRHHLGSDELRVSSATACFKISLATVATWNLFVINYIAQLFLDDKDSWNIPFAMDVVIDLISKSLFAGLILQLQEAIVCEHDRRHQAQIESLMSKIWKVMHNTCCYAVGMGEFSMCAVLWRYFHGQHRVIGR